MSEYSVVGKSVPRVDAVDRVTGKSLFAADIRLARMLHGGILYSTRPHARILSIDIRRAEKLPGVRAVITGKDVPRKRFGTIVQDEYILAQEKVLLVGDRVAAVAADTPEIAEEALSLIKVEYQDLPSLFDPVEAMRPGAPVLHEEWESYGSGAFRTISDRNGNICGHTEFITGDTEKGFQEADMVFEDQYTTPMVHQSYIEPHAATAMGDPSGQITVWSTTQGQFQLRADLAQLFDLPLSRVKVIPTEVGGAFGGKIAPLLEPVCVALSKATGRPVQIVMSRGEELMAARPRHPAQVTIKTGVKKDGTITAREIVTILDCGAYADFGPGAAYAAAAGGKGPYNIPNARMSAFCVYTNKPSGGSYRAPGGPQVTFAIESHMDTIARSLDMDPLELRLKNGLKEGDISYIGKRIERGALRDTLHRAAEGIGWGEPKEGPNRGRGLASAQWSTSGAASGLTVKINDDGTVSVVTGSVDLTGSNTIIAQAVSEELDLPIASIQVVTGDTDTALNAPVSGGSMIAYNMGKAALLAARDARQQLFEVAAERLKVPQERLRMGGGEVWVDGEPEKRLTFSSATRTAQRFRGTIIVGKGSSPATMPPTFMMFSQAAEVEVDPQTGQVTIHKLIASHDVGFALNPLSVEGQLQGGMAQGLGAALSEEVRFKDGRVENPSFMDYKIPTAVDLPFIETAIVQQSSDEGPYGAKGVGEPPIVPPAAAIANAIHDAVGVRIKDLPITPEKVLQALKEKSGR